MAAGAVVMPGEKRSPMSCEWEAHSLAIKCTALSENGMRVQALRGL